MIKIFTISAIIILFTVIGCNIFDTETTDLEPIEGSILFTVTLDNAEIVPSHAGFLLLMKTEKIYNCYNFEIKTFMTTNQNTINIELRGIYLPDICATALGPARSRIPLDISNGEYELIFSYEENTDKYILSIDGLDIDVTKVDTSFTVYKLFNNSF